MAHFAVLQMFRAVVPGHTATVHNKTCISSTHAAKKSSKVASGHRRNALKICGRNRGGVNHRRRDYRDYRHEAPRLR